MFDIDFDLEEMKKSNCLITATNSMGKSRLSCGIAHNLMRFNWKIIAFDTCGNYKEISDIPHRIKVYPKSEKLPNLPIDTSVVFDLSLMRPSEQMWFVNYCLESLWDFKVMSQSTQWHLILLEEMQLYAKSVRGFVQQNLLRIMSSGRNQKIRVLGVGVDLALIDPCFIRLCQQRYHGRLGIEENAKRKFKAYYGKDFTRIACEGLECGDFIYVNGSKIQIVSVPLFTPKHTPQPLTTRQPTLRERIKNALS
ncbi:DUF87 domain-containing protein [Candidatus Bathyarchaeota archaeon]|nr:DUF87 domain-containing protein [Candidatus Bathyarchaeota archaeon]